MKERDLKYITLSANSFNKKKKYNKIKFNVGFDTETEKGKCFLLGYWDNKEKYILSSMDINKILELLSSRKFLNTNNFFYNIDYDFQAIIKLLPYDNLRELGKWDKTIYKDFKIETIKGKMFSISKNNKNKIKYYDLMQFYNFNSLNNSGIKFLGLNKENLKDVGIDIKNLSFKKYNSDLDYKNLLDKYLYRDCEITYKLANKLYDLVEPYIIPKVFYSQASFSQQYFLENIKKSMNLPTKNILQYALNSYQGGRFEVFKRGNFKKGYVADIKSAYPNHNIKIPDLSKGIWKKDNNYREDSLVSLYKIDTEIYDIKISPLKYQIKNKRLLYPIGKFKDLYINKSEIEILNKLGFKYKIKNAFHYFDNDPIYPYEFLKDFYNLKEKFKKEGKKELSWIPKIIINGFYGKTIQINPKFKFEKEFKGNDRLYDVNSYKGKLIYTYKHFKAGSLFNPVVANEITANTRSQLFNSCYKNMKDVIGFQTDSIITSKKLNNIKYGKNLGDWEIENKGRLIILGSGVYQILNDDNSLQKVRMRGFGKSLNLYELLSQNKNKTSIKIDITKNLKLKQMLKLKLSEDEKLELFNVIRDDTKKININFDKKRYWNRDFKNCDDVLNNKIDSKPIII